MFSNATYAHFLFVASLIDNDNNKALLRLLFVLICKHGIFLLLLRYSIIIFSFRDYFNASIEPFFEIKIHILKATIDVVLE